MAERAADGAAVAHRAIGDGTCDALHGAACNVGDAPVLDVAMGDAGADNELVAAALRLLQFRKPR